MGSQSTLRLAVCLFESVTTLDYQGPVELFGFLTPDNIQRFPLFKASEPAYAIEITYLAHTLDPVTTISGPSVLASRTYDSVKADEQFDLILIPGGPNARPGGVPDSLLDFVKRQDPGVKHILTVCTGSWVLAGTGLLRGKKATSNKWSFKLILEDTRDAGIEWVARARWVVNDDKKIWTSSGVTAGVDMANAFLEYLVGPKVAEIIRGVVELSAKGEGDDEFADYYGLV